VGFSATPCRLDGSGLRTAFEALATGPTVSQLVSGGHLCPVDAWSLASVDLVGLGETDPEMVRRVAPLVGDAIRHWRVIGMERPAIAFCASVEAARSLAERFRAEGVPSECVDGKMPHEDRQRAVDGLRNGRVQVLTSCEIVSEGFDCPGAEVALLMRPTKSLSLHLQQVGRVMRPAPGKKAGIVLDMVGNVLRHGLPDDPREWSLDGAPPRRTGVAGLIIRTCPGCFRAFRPAPCCPRCGTEIPAKPRKVEMIDGALRKWSAEELRREREQVRIRQRDEMRVAARQGLDALHALAIKRGYAPGWARKYFAASRGR
jgi:superfamily II DNA or RNA helicase